MKPKLLVFELWRVGDLAVATPFIRSALKQFEVTVLAQSTARPMQQRFWPEAKLVEFTVPWTAFYGKYRLLQWPWKDFGRLIQRLRAERFDAAVTSRWDIREHVLLRMAGAKETLSYPDRGSGVFLLSKRLVRLGRLAHRYEDWWVAAQALGLDLPARAQIPMPPPRRERKILIHTGAALAVRVWPLDRYHRLITRLRQNQFAVEVACDPGQRDWWIQHGEKDVQVPTSLEQLLEIIDGNSVLIGNDSGPGHLAALLGVPTFTFFGPQLSEWFAPIHPAAEWIDGKPCPHKQCFDYCRFPVPHCIQDITEAEARDRIDKFLAKLSL